jgi:hypothetical protein
MIVLVSKDGVCYKVQTTHDSMLIMNMVLYTEPQDVTRVPLEYSSESVSACADGLNDCLDLSQLDHDMFREFVLVASYLESQILIDAARVDFQRRLYECRTPEDLRLLAGNLVEWSSEEERLEAIQQLPDFVGVDKHALASVFRDR